MKTRLFFACLAVTDAAQAQKPAATHPSITYKVGMGPAYLYREPADTASKSRQYLSPGEEAYVVGDYSPRWAVVRRTGALYLVKGQNLTGYAVGDGAAVPIDAKTGLITYEGVVQVPGVTQAALYARANAWITNTYRSANAVIEMQNKEAGQLIAKGLVPVTIRSLGMGADGGVVRHTLTIYVKDNKYKYVLTGLTHEATGAPNLYSGGALEQQVGHLFPLDIGAGKAWAEIRRQGTQDARRLVGSLQAAMTLPGTKDPSDF